MTEPHIGDARPYRFAVGPTVAGMDCGCGGCPDCRPNVAEVATRLAIPFFEVLELVRRAEDVTLVRLVALRDPDPDRASRRRVERAQRKAAEAAARASKEVARTARAQRRKGGR